MNKYLLLRDNKQSGPYSVAELIEKGIKPYDLVWLEGKSAAWRYPGEMEELKPHSPNTEDQPFDRFYKKPESIEHARFEPRPTSAKKTESQPSKKIYINFPAAVTKVHQTTSVSPSEIIKEERQLPEPIIKYITQPPAKTQNRNILFIAAGATGILILSLITYFVVNNNSQAKNINQLNALVQQLEQNAKAGNTDIIIPAINEIEQAATIEEPIIQKTSVEKNAVSIQENNIKTSEPSIKEKPITNQLSELPTTAAPSTAPENLYKLVSVKSNNYKTGVLGGISNLQLELTNNSKIELHKVAIEVKYLGPEKKVVRTQIVYFENVAAGAHSTIDVPKSNRGVTVDYIITDIKS